MIFHNSFSLFYSKIKSETRPLENNAVESGGHLRVFLTSSQPPVFPRCRIFVSLGNRAYLLVCKWNKSIIFSSYLQWLSIFLSILNNVIVLWIYCRGQPPDYLLRDAKNTSKFFKCIGSLQSIENSESAHTASVYQALTGEEYEAVCFICYCFSAQSLSKMNTLQIIFSF